MKICLLCDAVIFIKAIRYKHETSLVKDAKLNQELVCYNREFVITEFDCSFKSGQNWLKLIILLY